MRVQYLSFPILVAFALGAHLVTSSHFRGGTIQWRPANPGSFDGMVRLYNIMILINGFISTVPGLSLIIYNHGNVDPIEL
jgi:hypothetical protein